MYVRQWHCRLDILLSVLTAMIVHVACLNDACSQSRCLYGSDYCDPDNGRCLYGCMPGYVGVTCSNICTSPECTECIKEDNGLQKCTRCPSGMYGPQCNLACSEHCLGSGDVCDQFGNCFHGCERLYYGNTCTEQNCSFAYCKRCAISYTGYETCATCNPGFWWEQYNRKCIECQGHCLQGDFDCTTNGECLSKSCQPGWTNPSCTTKCQMDNCEVCARKDGEDTCITCKPGTRPGAIGEAQCVACPTPNNCVEKTCNSTTGGCSECKPGFYGYDCSLQCTTCADALCKQYSGECLSCNQGDYGPRCHYRCSSQCSESLCEKSTGYCLKGCNSGYTGPKCDISCSGPCKKCVGHCLNDTCDPINHFCKSCENGWYGDTCGQTCSEGCNSGLCERDTGHCIGACVNNLYGSLCTRRCGINCVDQICDKETGRCLLGCNVGYHGSWCRNYCLEVCLNQTCEMRTGACLKCGVGLQGDQCDLACDPWRYGLNCESVCGRCLGGAPCNGTTGHCPMGCAVGWTGIMCDQESDAEPVPTVMESSEMSSGIKAAIGSSVAGVVCCLVIVAGLCWWKRRHRTLRKTTEEPSVTFSGMQANIELVHRPSTSILLNTPGTSNQANGSDTSTSGLLGDGNGASQIRLGNRIHVGTLYNIHKGTMMSEGQSTQCCIKLYHLSHPDIVDRDDFMHQLKREIEILFLCRSSNNVMKLLTTAQASDFYCIAMDMSLATGLLPYLHEMQTGSHHHSLEGTKREQLVRISVDVCTAVKHMHELKVIHRALRAGHVYLSDSLVAKVGDFDWAERTDSEEEAIPRSNLPAGFTPWMAPECLVRDEFSYQSDIWSLGMLLWEIFALGESPYQDLGEDDQRQAILEGMHPPKPRVANTSMYHMMKGCWKYEPANRLSLDHTLQQLQAMQVSMRLSSGTGHSPGQDDRSDHIQLSSEPVSDSASNQPPGDISNGTFRQPVNARVVIDKSDIAQSCPDILGASMKLGQTNRQIAQSHMNIGQFPHAGDSRRDSEARSYRPALQSVPDTNKRLSLAVDTKRLDTDLRYNRPYQSVAGGLDRGAVCDRGEVSDVGRIREMGHRSVDNSRSSASCSDMFKERDTTSASVRERLGGPYEGAQRSGHSREIPRKSNNPYEGTQSSGHSREIPRKSDRHGERNDKRPSDTYYQSRSGNPPKSRSAANRYRSGDDDVHGSSGFRPCGDDDVRGSSGFRPCGDDDVRGSSGFRPCGDDDVRGSSGFRPCGDDDVRGSSGFRPCGDDDVRGSSGFRPCGDDDVRGSSGFRPHSRDDRSRNQSQNDSEASRCKMTPHSAHEPSAGFSGHASSPNRMSRDPNQGQPYRDPSQGQSHRPYEAKRHGDHNHGLPYREPGPSQSRRPNGAQSRPLRTNLAMARSCPDIAERSSDLGQTNRELTRSYMDIGGYAPRVVDIDIDTPSGIESHNQP